MPDHRGDPKWPVAQADRHSTETAVRLHPVLELPLPPLQFLWERPQDWFCSALTRVSVQQRFCVRLSRCWGQWTKTQRDTWCPEHSWCRSPPMTPNEDRVPPRGGRAGQGRERTEQHFVWLPERPTGSGTLWTRFLTRACPGILKTPPLLKRSSPSR